MKSPHCARHGRRVRLLLLLFVVIVCAGASPTTWRASVGGETLPVTATERASGESGVENSVTVSPATLPRPDRSGESLLYTVFAGMIPVGEAQYRHRGKVERDGRQLNLMTVDTRVVGFSDQEEIYSDPETFLPVLVKRIVSRVVKPEYIEERYDQKNFTLQITRRRFTSERLSFVKDGPIQNAILLPYAVRDAADLAPGWRLTANMPQRSYIITLSGEETIRVPAGTFAAYHFVSEPAAIELWISRDKNRIPVKVIGSGLLEYRLELRVYVPPRTEHIH